MGEATFFDVDLRVSKQRLASMLVMILDCQIKCWGGWQMVLIVCLFVTASLRQKERATQKKRNTFDSSF
jgi:Ca2+/Na+ antiporter